MVYLIGIYGLCCWICINQNVDMETMYMMFIWILTCTMGGEGPMKTILYMFTLNNRLHYIYIYIMFHDITLYEMKDWMWKNHLKVNRRYIIKYDLIILKFEMYVYRTYPKLVVETTMVQHVEVHRYWRA